MGFHFADNAITAKIRAIYGGRLTASQYDELCHKKNTAEIAAYLKERTAYGRVLAAIQPAAVQSSQLTSILRKHNFEVYENLIRYASPDQRTFYQTYVIDLIEIQLILQMIRLLNTGHMDEFIVNYPAFAESSVRISLDRMVNVRSFDDLLRALEHTEYHDLLLGHRPVAKNDCGGQGTIDYTACEAALMTYYYDAVQKSIHSHFKGRTREQLENIFSLKIGLENLILVYRFKRFYPNTSASEIQRYLLPFWKPVRPRQLDKMLAAKSPEEFLQLVSQLPYAKHLQKDDFTYIEYGSQSVRYDISKRYIRFAQDAPTAFIAFMFLSEMEIESIARIIEAVRYGMDPADILKLLVID